MSFLKTSVNTGEEQVYPLRNKKVDEVLKKQGMEHCCVKPWSFGQEGEEEHKLKWPGGIATNHRGQFLIADLKTVKVFDSNGKFDFRFNPQTDDADTLHIWDVTTAGEDDKIHILVQLKKRMENEVQVFNKTADPQHKFPVMIWIWGWVRLTVSSGKQRGNILLLAGDVHVYEPSGEFVCSVGGVLKGASDRLTVLCETKRNETKRNEMVLCETVLCEMVLCETVLCETVTQPPKRLNFSRWRPNPEN